MNAGLSLDETLEANQMKGIQCLQNLTSELSHTHIQPQKAEPHQNSAKHSLIFTFKTHQASKRVKATMSGRGKGGKGLGKGGAKRHRKVLRDNIQGEQLLFARFDNVSVVVHDIR